jgi:hypothetical protein
MYMLVPVGVLYMRCWCAASRAALLLLSYCLLRFGSQTKEENLHVMVRFFGWVLLVLHQHVISASLQQAAPN